MANTKGSANSKSFMYPGKHPLLPPKSPFPTVSSSYADYAQSTAVGSKVLQRPKDGNTHHQRTSSESILVEEQPSWLDDLLNEPETPVRRGGHRRSSSDSFAYLDAPNLYGVSYATPDRYKNMGSMPLWRAQDFDNYRDVRLASQYTEANLPNSRAFNAVTHSRIPPSARDNLIGHNPGLQSAAKEGDGVPTITTNEKQDTEISSLDVKTSSEKKDGSHAKSETDTKRAKQQFAQRSRVRKLQYIAELERNVQALQAEGSEISAEVEFLNQQTLILSMENKALNQRLESLAQEQLIKYMEHEVLEREIGRLRALYQQLQHQQQPPQQQQSSSSHRRASGTDLDSEFANLSLRHKDARSGHDPVTGPLRT